MIISLFSIYVVISSKFTQYVEDGLKFIQIYRLIDWAFVFKAALYPTPA